MRACETCLGRGWIKEHPCEFCEMAHGSIGTDGNGGYVHTDCHTDCTILKEWNEKQKEKNQQKEHLFGDNIRDAIRTIKGR